MSLGSSSDDIAKDFGQPDMTGVSNGFLIWTYDGLKDHGQRASLVFDQNTKTLKEKTILLTESDTESKLDNLLKEKFRSIKFREVRFPQCGRDFVPDEALYIGDSQGISIQFSKSQRFASATSWSSPADLKKDIEEIKNCKTRNL